eukprot:CAMPEP_0182435328 /NCGR_PEP_ID=MMETSP1167-20130531/75152_1 /TAXON_ID=2988 /ORGANISM="Mallomonas Sp, Strain CCMP3275" /LENGTH=64 /DNA_ID=CAMNT_0024626273 /DNA_START=326 /DNA_END=517 /DNA_ORIENTATION=+
MKPHRARNPGQKKSLDSSGEDAFSCGSASHSLSGSGTSSSSAGAVAGSCAPVSTAESEKSNSQV